ncbi:MAG: cellulase family glycosylhydrolase [Candidatus Sigynarchaeota archaeon]
MEVLTRIHPSGRWFIDEHGRVVILRGVNLGGDCKVPYTPDGRTHIPTDFSGHENVSFIGRPFPLDDAQVHFERLKAWGFNTLRLLTTWEAVEHAGPGELDTAYLDYFTTLCKMARDHGFYVFIDFHEDVWSRMTGGDGAPCWLFEKVGIDYTKLSTSDAALVMQHAYDYNDPRPRQEDKYPSMCWGQNAWYPGNAIMWTLFFSGRDFAPEFTIDGVNVQDYMQGHYIQCMRAVAERVKDLPNVMGFDSLNEPRSGWAGIAMNDRHLKATKNNPALPGIAWSPIDCLYAASGHAVTIPVLELRIAKLGIVPVREVVVNKNRIRLWREGRGDPFQAAGAWRLKDDGKPEILRNDFFQVVNGRKVNFTTDYMVPFIFKVADAIQAINPGWMIFGEKDPKETVYDRSFPASMPKNFVNASHWYDNAISGTKKVRKITLDVVDMKLVAGKHGIQRMYTKHFGEIKEAADRVNGGSPVLIGEFGIVYDLENGKAYERWHAGDHGDAIWKDHTWTLDMMYNALDHHLLSATQWAYTASNRNDPRIGDGWNQEDCSVYSDDQRDDPGNINSGGRAMKGFVRPFARCIQGTPLKMAFDMKKGRFTLRFVANPAIQAPTEVRVPWVQFPDGYVIDAPGLDIIEDRLLLRVSFVAKEKGEYSIRINRSAW